MDHFSKKSELDVQKILRDLPLFRRLQSDDFKSLKDNLTKENFTKGQFIITEGDAGDKFYIVAEGAVSIRKGKQEIAQLGPGDYFGEAALLSDSARLASVLAADKVSVLSLTRDKFNELFKSGNKKLKVAFAKRMAVSADTASNKNYTASIPAGATKTKTEAVKQFILGAVQYNVLFMNLTPEHTRALIDEMYKTEIKEGVSAIVQGDAGDNLYVVEEGDFAVYVNQAKVAIRGK